jgi:hypothetical protein
MSIFLGTTSDKLNSKQKRRLLADIVQLNVGYDNDQFVGRPLSYYNWDAVTKLRDSLKKKTEEDYY